MDIQSSDPTKFATNTTENFGEDILKRVTSIEDAIMARNELRSKATNIREQLTQRGASLDLNAYEYLDWQRRARFALKLTNADIEKLNAWIKAYEDAVEASRQEERIRNGGLTDRQRQYLSHLDRLILLVRDLEKDGVELHEDEQACLADAEQWAAEKIERKVRAFRGGSRRVPKHRNSTDVTE